MPTTPPSATDMEAAIKLLASAQISADLRCPICNTRNEPGETACREHLAKRKALFGE